MMIRKGYEYWNVLSCINIQTSQTCSIVCKVVVVVAVVAVVVVVVVVVVVTNH